MLKEPPSKLSKAPSLQPGHLLADIAPDLGFESAAVGLAQLGLDGTFLNVNRRAAGFLTGSGARLQDLSHPPERDAFERSMMLLAAGRVAYFARAFDVDPSQGSPSRLHATVTLVRTSKGCPDHLLAVIEPVVDRQPHEFEFRHVLDNLATFVGLLDVDGTLLRVNEPALQAAGLQRSDVIGKPFETTFWWAHDRDVQARLRRAIDRAAAGEASRYDEKVRVGHNAFMTIDFQIVPLRDETGRIDRLLPSAVDISSRKAKEAELARTASQLQLAMDVGRLGLCIFEFGSRALTTSGELRAAYGFGPDDEPTIANLVERIHPDDRYKVRRALRSMLNAGVDYDLVHRVVWPNGTVRRIAMRGRLLEEDSRRRAFWVTADITQRHLGEEARVRTRQRELVVRELGHRLNNLFPVVISIAGVLAAQHRTLFDYRQALEGRLRSLWATHGLLTRGISESATVEELVRIEIKPFAAHRVSVCGPEVSLSGGLAEGFAMIMHELATNAAKHGALSAAGGRVEVDWSVDHDGLLDLSWRERGGPAVRPPMRTGFGAAVIGGTDLPPVCGEAEIRYLPAGISYRLRLSIDG